MFHTIEMHELRLTFLGRQFGTFELICLQNGRHRKMKLSFPLALNLSPESGLMPNSEDLIIKIESSDERAKHI